MRKVITDFNTVVLISKTIGLKKTILLLQKIVNKQRGDINSNDVKDIYDEEYFHIISNQQIEREIAGIKINSYINMTISYFEELNKKELRILDFGCGSGNFVLALASLGYKVDGFDYFEPMINSTRKLSKKLKIENSCNFYFDYKEFGEKRYDFIIFSDVVEHISQEELREIITDLKKHMSNNCSLIFHTPNGLIHKSCPKRIRLFDIYHLSKILLLKIKGSEKQKLEKLKSAYYDQVHINIMTPKELKNILKKEGFSDFKTKYYNKKGKSLFKKLKSTGSFWLICQKVI